MKDCLKSHRAVPNEQYVSQSGFQEFRLAPLTDGPSQRLLLCCIAATSFAAIQQPSYIRDFVQAASGVFHLFRSYIAHVSLAEEQVTQIRIIISDTRFPWRPVLCG